MSSKLELKVPPVLVVLATGVLMWLASRAAPAMTGILTPRFFCAAFFAALGLLVCFLGVASFRRARTTMNPLRPQSATSLVTSGIYRRTRNPMYLGLLLVLLGWAVFLSSLLAFLGLPVYVLYMNRFQIVPEERMLTALFGQEFVTYRSRVRRWV